MLLSLIIPVYKVEQYIAECIESVINQVTSDIEVIIVNDGTPDDSMLVIEKILSKQTAIIRDCFIILHQENQGQSSARNLGLKYAKGEYISFLDSDDVLSENYLSDFKNTIKKNNVDIVQFKSSRFEEDTNKLKAFNVGLQRNGLLQLDQNLMIEIFNQSAWFPWLNIYRRELFNGLEFPVGIYYEDAALIPEVFLRAKNIYFLESVLYFYRLNLNGSLLNTSSENKRKHVDSFKSILELYALRMKENPIYSISFVSMSQAFVNYMYQNFGWKVAYKCQATFQVNKKDVDVRKLSKRGNRLYYYFGFYFIAFLNLRG
ncbi:glycosyltransferase, group 2 family protein [Acinetobacter lwoffii SH145]|uniref:glycosyltransferase family 2 protein n=1 Tax=Acinetobacter lwoffii TaxID=28090 RepID=UPI0001BBA60D|nr:glycosyltransferase [Acinetobacter lwoffii]EEY89313.1 glycosyltransferase, group 2 family protein [Acinetobacter lwoffii SH145]